MDNRRDLSIGRRVATTTCRPGGLAARAMMGVSLRRRDRGFFFSAPLSDTLVCSIFWPFGIEVVALISGSPFPPNTEKTARVLPRLPRTGGFPVWLSVRDNNLPRLPLDLEPGSSSFAAPDVTRCSRFDEVTRSCHCSAKNPSELPPLRFQRLVGFLASGRSGYLEIRAASLETIQQ